MPAKKTDAKRPSPACPGCAAPGIKQETTVKGRTQVIVWRCSSCDRTWMDRRG